jgi:hypothetical protein
MADTTVELSASCHCKASTYSFRVDKSALPLPAYLCSCDISRRISGVLFTSYAAIPPAASISSSSGGGPPDLTGLTAYRSSNALKRHFCSTCGTHMFLEYDDDGHFEVSTGTLNQSDGIVQFKGHMWIESSNDGGGSDWLPFLGDRKAERWLRGAHDGPEAPDGWKSQASISAASKPPSSDDKLHAHCHCGGVQLYVSRPNAESLLASSPLPDLLVPYHTGADVSNPENKPWWMSTDKQRHLAGNCACNSCRLIAGFDITQWAFVPVANISLQDGEPFRRGFGSIKIYRSSDKARRHFCSVCGAHVFYDADDRPTLVDIAVGLFDSETGCRAEDFLEWETDRVSFSEEAFNRELVDSLEKGLREWRRPIGSK